MPLNPSAPARLRRAALPRSFPWVALAFPLAALAAAAPGRVLAQPAAALADGTPLRLDGATLRAGRLRVPLPAEPDPATLRVEPGPAGVAVVRAGTAPEVLVVLRLGARPGSPTLLATGRLDLHGPDAGERQADVIELRDRTGDGVPDLVVATRREDRTLCGRPETLLRARAYDPASGRLRPVQLRQLPAEVTATVRATREAPDLPEQAPLTPALAAGPVSSQRGRPAEAPGLATALLDGDASTAWREGDGGDGRYEFATLRWSAEDLRLAALAFVPRPRGARGDAAPAQLHLLTGEARVDVAFPEPPAPGETWWVRLPEPLPARCLSVVLGGSFPGEGTVTALAELRAYTDLDFAEDPAARLLARLASGEDPERTVRLLVRLGDRALAALREGDEARPAAERRLVVQVYAAQADRSEAAREGLVDAARDDDERTRNAALEALGRCAADCTGRLASLVGPTEAGEAAAQVLAQRDPNAAVGPLLSALGAPGGPGRRRLRETLADAARRAEAASLSAALAAWDDPETEARAAAALALAGTEAGAALHDSTRDAAESFPSRWRLVRAAQPRDDAASLDLARAGGPDTWLARLAAGAEEWMLRREALDALAARDAEGWPRLAAEALGDDVPRVRAHALSLLRRVPHDAEDPVFLRMAALARRDSWPRVRAAGVAAIVGTPAGLPVVRAALGDPSRDVREAAVRALTEAPDDDPDASWPRVRERLADEDEFPAVVMAAANYAAVRCRGDALEAFGPVLDRALRPTPWSPDVDAAVVAIEAAGALGGPGADALLTRAEAETAPPSLRAAAHRARRRGARCP